MTESQLRNQVVSIMRGWLGYSESNGKHKTIVDIYNAHKPLARNYKVKYTDHWCATCVSAAFIEADLTDIAPTECSCAKMIELFKKIGRFEEDDSYRAKVGDIVMYDWDDNGVGDNTGHPDHVGIVASVNGDTMRIIEGNISNKVGYRTLKVNAKYIRGYCLPDYASKAGNEVEDKTGKMIQVEVPILTKGNKGGYVETLQMLLNGNDCECDVDGSFGPATQKAVKEFQKFAELDVDGSVGPATWASLLK